MSKNDFEGLWANARTRYAEISGQDLEDIPMPRTTEDLIKAADSQNSQYKHFREKQGTLFAILSAALKPIELISNLAAGSSSTAFPPSSLCFSAVLYLVNAAHGVSASLDAITDLLGVLRDFTVRLNVYNREDLSQELSQKLAEILIVVIEILARSTKIIKEGILHRFKSLSKHVLLGNDKDTQDLIARLDRLTQSETRLVSAETLVEAKRTGRAVDAVQLSVSENTSKLSQLTVSANEVSAGVDQILDTLEESKAQARAEKDTKHLEAVKRVLRPSVLAQDRFDEIRRDHVPESGQWICLEEALQDWISSKAPILWISGNPGSGKSFLTYNIVTYLFELHQDTTNQAAQASVGYFFFRDNKDQTRSVEQALRDVSYQIAQTDQAYAKHIANVSHKDPDVTSIRSAWQTLFIDYFIGENNESSAFIVLDGIDESMEDGRATFFELLKDLQEAGADYRLHVAMLGRPQIIEEIADELGEAIPTIQVDWTKNGGDIARYVELSISKSRVLHRVSRSLKQLIVRTLVSKANGMFMWVKLMVLELSKKSRESAIKESLNSAPRGLTDMLRHVLEGFSRTLSDDEAADLNEMLCWVALAKRPLALGELDAVFRVKSPTGEGILYLEGKLRKQFASFFTLTREDNLTTADLQSPKKKLEDDEDAQAGADPDEGLDDVENETDFDSNPSTTTLSFSHTSISDLFRDARQGKVTAPGGDHPAVGVDLNQARLNVVKTCLELILDESLRVRMKDAIDLQPYAAQYWKDYLDELDRKDVDDEDVISIGRSLVRMMEHGGTTRSWVGAKGYSFFTPITAKTLLDWITDEIVLRELPADSARWINSIIPNPVELFEPGMKFIAKRWLIPSGDEYKMNVAVQIIYCYILRKAGEVVDKVSKMSVDDLQSTAEWAGFERSAEWHRRVAIVLRDFSWFDAAFERFNKALELDPGMWLAKAGISKIFFARKQYRESLQNDEAVLKMAKENDQMQEIYKRMGDCYTSLSGDEDEVSDSLDTIRLLKMALESYKKAFAYSDVFYECIDNSLEILDIFAYHSDVILRKGKDSEKDAKTELPSKRQCFEQVMEIVHAMNDTAKDGTTNLVKYLHKNKYDDTEIFQIIALGAIELNEVEWLQGRYREAINLANKRRQPVVSACLALCLARLYAQYGNEEDRAVRIWETLGMEPVTSTALETDIGYARTEALNQLGQYCIRKAMEDESNAHLYVGKMERIVSKRRYGPRLGIAADSVPPNEVAIHLAAWYHKVGRDGDAREAVKHHIQDALIILSDDDPNNDYDGYWQLSRALMAIGDEVNAFAICYSLREYKDGLAVIDAQSDDEDGTESSDASKEDTENVHAQESNVDDDGRDPGWDCDGICGNQFDNCDGMIHCRYCSLEFCKECHGLLINGNLPIRICGSAHSFLTVPKLTQEHVFKEGELLVDGIPVPVEKWKADVKRQYGV